MAITYQAGRRIQGILGSEVLASAGWTFTTSNCSISNEVLNVATASDDSRAYRSHTITDDQNWVVDMDCYTGSGGEGHVIHCLKLSKLSTIADDQFAFRLNNTGGNVSLYIQERLSGSNNQQGPTATISQNTQYYMRFIRNGSTVYWKVYTSDSNRTSDTSATTVSLSLTSPSVRSISYIQHGSETTGNTVSGIKIDNIKIYHNMVTPSGTPAYETDFTDGYSGDTKPTNVQVGSRFEETDTRKMYQYIYDWFLEGITWTFTDDLSSSTPWTSVGSGITVTGGEISMAGVAASGSNYLWRSLSHTLSDTLWTMEFDYKSTGQSGGSVFFPFGVKSSVSPLSPNSGDSLRMRDDTDNAYLGPLSSTIGGADDTTTASIAWTEGSFYYPRIGRTNSTTMKYQLFSDAARTTQVGSTLTATISSSITGLDTLVCGGGDGGDGTSTGKISNIYISESDLFT